MIWSIPDLLPSAAPQLIGDERYLLSVDSVGLYNGDVKSTDHANGTIFLTTQRLVYVDSGDPVMHSVQVNLSQVSSATYIQGFLKSSAKIDLSVNSAVEEGVKPKAISWICSICSFANPGTSTHCSSCGVIAQDDAEIRDGNVSIPVLGPGECPQCTFRNHPSLPFCEMCGAPLKEPYSRASSLGSRVKISFRKGHSHAFHSQLINQLELVRKRSTAASDTGNNDVIGNDGHQTANEDTYLKPDNGFGIRRLKDSTRKSNAMHIELLNRAIENPAKEFKLVSNDIVAIAERLGTPRSVPIITAVDAGHSVSLARQLADLLIGQDLLVLAGGMLTLHDLYALINRSRGIGLISPMQLTAALDQCEPLNLPLRRRTLQSGLKVVESRGALDQAIQRILQWIISESRNVPWRAGAGFSARDVSDKMNCSVQIAAEELALAEQRGKLCRDEHTSGLRFFPNLFLEVNK